MRLQPLFAILIAVAMLFAPFAMPTGSAMAAAPAMHHSEAMTKGHCDEQPASGQSDKLPGKPCCLAMCSAIAVSPLSPSAPLILSKMVAQPSTAPFQHGILTEIATPPPRAA